MNELDRVRELLPWHVQGTLESDERVFMDRWLAENLALYPDIKAELAWLKATATQLQGLAQSYQALADAGLPALMQRIAQEKTGRSADRQGSLASQQTSLLTRFTGWVTDWLGAPTPILALGLVVLAVVQTAVIGGLIFTAPASQVPLGSAPVPISAAPGKVLLTLAFRPDASEASIRGLLTSVGLQIVAGPSALGLYVLAVPAEQAESSLVQLRLATSVVESVQR